ncbi:hypothetical protein CCACVL1_16535 [Corchorus capsularis]|uniref:Uncharacterized protein n=1 Tax=Corchorus capsularis TaxID=210143 RepID=A0A1R3HWE2_COCAP|nr:hypothetical protein CCACVL1_16535 [Corchorus capsularis]
MGTRGEERARLASRAIRRQVEVWVYRK